MVHWKRLYKSKEQSGWDILNLEDLTWHYLENGGGKYQMVSHGVEKSYSSTTFKPLPHGTSTVGYLDGDRSSGVEFLATYQSSDVVSPTIFRMVVRSSSGLING